MTSRRKILAVALCGVVAASAVCIFALRDDEPTYRGRTLSDWLWQYVRINYGYTTGPPATRESDEAAAAIRQIGTNGIPLFLKWGEARDSKTKILLREAFEHLPEVLRPDDVTTAFYKNSAAAKQQLAFGGFILLGTNAVPALDTLAQKFRSSTDDSATLWGNCLAGLGPEGLRVLLTKENLRNNYQIQATVNVVVNSRATINSNAVSCVPLLLELLHGSDDELKFVGAVGLGKIGSNPGKVVPELIDVARSTNDYVRLPAIIALGDYGKAASNAIPVIEAALSSENSSIAAEAKHALEQIAPNAMIQIRGNNRQAPK